MENFRQNLKDPAWWFTAVFVAILVTIISIILHKWIMNLLSHFSNYIKKKREIAKNQLQKEIDSIATDPHLITFEYIRATILIKCII